MKQILQYIVHQVINSKPKDQINSQIFTHKDDQTRVLLFNYYTINITNVANTRTI